MIGTKIKNPEDFTRGLQRQKTHCVNPQDRFTYCVVSHHSGVGVVNAITTDSSLNSNEDFNPDESDGLRVRLTGEIEEPFQEVRLL